MCGFGWTALWVWGWVNGVGQGWGWIGFGGLENQLIGMGRNEAGEFVYPGGFGEGLFLLFFCGFLLSIPRRNVSVLWRMALMDESVVGGLRRRRVVVRVSCKIPPNVIVFD